MARQTMGAGGEEGGKGGSAHAPPARLRREQRKAGHSLSTG